MAKNFIGVFNLGNGCDGFGDGEKIICSERLAAAFSGLKDKGNRLLNSGRDKFRRDFGANEERSENGETEVEDVDFSVARAKRCVCKKRESPSRWRPRLEDIPSMTRLWSRKKSESSVIKKSDGDNVADDFGKLISQSEKNAETIVDEVDVSNDLERNPEESGKIDEDGGNQSRWSRMFSGDSRNQSRWSIMSFGDGRNKSGPSRILENRRDREPRFSEVDKDVRGRSRLSGDLKNGRDEGSRASRASEDVRGRSTLSRIFDSGRGEESRLSRIFGKSHDDDSRASSRVDNDGQDELISTIPGEKNQEEERRLSGISKNSRDEESRLSRIFNGSASKSRLSRIFQKSENGESRPSRISKDGQDELRLTIPVAKNPEEEPRLSGISKNSQDEESRLSRISKNSENGESRPSRISKDGQDELRLTIPVEKNPEEEPRLSGISKNSQDEESRLSRISKNSENGESRPSRISKDVPDESRLTIPDEKNPEELPSLSGILENIQDEKSRLSRIPSNSRKQSTLSRIFRKSQNDESRSSQISKDIQNRSRLSNPVETHQDEVPRLSGILENVQDEESRLSRISSGTKKQSTLSRIFQKSLNVDSRSSRISNRSKDQSRLSRIFKKGQDEESRSSKLSKDNQRESVSSKNSKEGRFRSRASNLSTENGAAVVAEGFDSSRDLGRDSERLSRIFEDVGTVVEPDESKKDGAEIRDGQETERRKSSTKSQRGSLPLPGKPMERISEIDIENGPPKMGEIDDVIVGSLGVTEERGKVGRTSIIVDEGFENVGESHPTGDDCVASSVRKSVEFEVSDEIETITKPKRTHRCPTDCPCKFSQELIDLYHEAKFLSKKAQKIGETQNCCKFIMTSSEIDFFNGDNKMCGVMITETQSRRAEMRELMDMWQEANEKLAVRKKEIIVIVESINRTSKRIDEVEHLLEDWLPGGRVEKREKARRAIEKEMRERMEILEDDERNFCKTKIERMAKDRESRHADEISRAEKRKQRSKKDSSALQNAIDLMQSYIDQRKSLLIHGTSTG